MNGLMTPGRALLAAAAVALAMGAGLLGAPQASAQEELIMIDSTSMAVGEEGAVFVDALSIGEPGLGAWTVDISYDSTIMTAVACIPEHGGVCNPMFDLSTVRVTGASAQGVEGDNTLASITFRCDAAGTSALNLDVPLLVDATIGTPQNIEAMVQGGSVTCSSAVPPSEDVFDCDDFLFQETAQDVYDQDPSDPHHLDEDGDGIACEDLPSADDGGGEVPDGGLPPAGLPGGVAPSGGQVAGWIIAVFAGIGVAGLTTFGVLRLRAPRPSVQRVRMRRR